MSNWQAARFVTALSRREQVALALLWGWVLLVAGGPLLLEPEATGDLSGYVGRVDNPEVIADMNPVARAGRCASNCALDVANGYREEFLDFVTRVREAFPQLIIIAGNVATREMTEALVLAGADVVKVGIGPGSVCTTRKVAGVGYPQLSSISDCADAAHGLGGHVMSDGGCAAPGDVAKAFGAGADFVMLGGMLAGHDESGGELVEQDGRQFKSFYGMSSRKAMETYFGEVAKHRAPEGKEVRVPYRGPIEPTLQAILGGLRSACSYVGAWRIKDLPKCTTFVRVTRTTNDVYNSFDVDD